MAKIISHYNGRDSKVKRLWRTFKEQDFFTKSSLVIMLFLTIMTPVVITTRLIFVNHAADNFYIAATGSGVESIFQMTEVTPTHIEPNTATLTWTTSAKSRSEITYWKNSFISNIIALFYVEKVSDPLYTTDHQVNLSQYLQPNTSYKYTITSTTRTGDVFNSPTYSFKTARKK